MSATPPPERRLSSESTGSEGQPNQAARPRRWIWVLAVGLPALLIVAIGGLIAVVTAALMVVVSASRQSPP